MLPLSLVLWQTVCQHEEIPNDVRRYLIIHFILPFEKAGRESILIDQFHHNIFTGSTDFTDLCNRCRSVTLAFLEKNPTLELDIRIDQSRITKYISTLSYVSRHYPLDYHGEILIPVLVKGVIIGNTRAFMVLYRQKVIDLYCNDYHIECFISQLRRDMHSLSKWDMFQEVEVETVLEYFLDKGGRDDLFLELISLWHTKCPNYLDYYLFTFSLSDQQKSEFSRITKWSLNNSVINK